MKSGFWYLRAVCPIPPFPYPPQIKCLQSIFWWKCHTCLGWICIQGGSLATIPPASDIHYSFFQLFHFQFFLPPFVWYSDCAGEIYIYLPFVKALAQESGANVGVGQGQDLAKEENLDVAGGKSSKAERRRLLEIAGNMCDLMRGIYQKNAMFFLSETKVLPTAVLCIMVIYTEFDFVYHHFDSWFGPELGWDLFALNTKTSQVTEYWRFTEFV